MSYDFGDVSEARRETMQAIESSGTGPEGQAEAALDTDGAKVLYRQDSVYSEGMLLLLQVA